MTSIERTGRAMGHGPSSHWRGVITALAAAGFIVLADGSVAYAAPAGGSPGAEVPGPPVTSVAYCAAPPNRQAATGPGNRIVRVPDAACDEQTPADAERPWPRWVYQRMPDPVVTEQTVITGYDEDGVPIEDTAMLPDYDQGGLNVPVEGAYLDDSPDFTFVPIIGGFDSTARGVSSRGGRITPSGAGSAAFGAFGGRVGTMAQPYAGVGAPRGAAQTAGVRAASPSRSSTISRGGLGGTSASNGAGSQGGKGGSSGS